MYIELKNIETQDKSYTYRLICACNYEKDIVQYDNKNCILNLNILDIVNHCNSFNNEYNYQQSLVYKYTFIDALSSGIYPCIIKGENEIAVGSCTYKIQDFIGHAHDNNNVIIVPDITDKDIQKCSPYHDELSLGRATNNIILGFPIEIEQSQEVHFQSYELCISNVNKDTKELDANFITQDYYIDFYFV